METKMVRFRRLTADASTFSEMLMILTEEARMSRGRAIMLAAQIRPSLYRRWMIDRHAGRIPEKRGRGSITSGFKFVGG